MSELHADAPRLTYRSLPILVSYITLAAALALNACRAIHKRYQAREKANDWASPARRAHFFIFAVLAILSLGATWFYMFAFFAHSYRNWEETRGVSDLQGAEVSILFKLELWLQNAKLFREAWETVIETPARFWWSGQIFLWTTGWSVFLGIMARRYRISHAWAYMLLGQIVAISFAQNLFFATILVSKEPTPAKQDEEKEPSEGFSWSPPLYSEILPVAISLLSTVAVPMVAHTKYFMATLLIPHLLLFVPAILRPSRSEKNRVATKTRSRAQDADNTTRRYIVFFQLLAAICVLLQAHSTLQVLEHAEAGEYRTLTRVLFAAIYEHPAVSSVSWDVIFCTVTAMAWFSVNGGDPKRMLGK
ncbi:uncharacterized protein N7477_004158 [Penicillium maclennaniae]|uniref:uncharacterized protein n=1 Tax=Penicillium maclennaniae TaxID=1343394 RepID=UPI002541CFCE|nr:uncharacterized protein N7477_004158 [Penicillium maclennaniae]KAJ5678525.1 hypothetical protein N7477_004158 [Penicillium maclennaniae]